MTKRKRNPAIKPKENFLSHAMLNTVAAYLEANGWSVALIGGTAVQQQPHEREYNFEFVVRFTGAKRDAAPPKPPAL